MEDDLDRTIALYNDALRYIQDGGEDSWNALLGLADAWVEIDLIQGEHEQLRSISRTQITRQRE